MSPHEHGKIKIIGLTGGVATGKSTIAGMFADLGAKIINADQIAHELIQSDGLCYRSVLREFGNEILEGKEIDRSKLSKIVFRDTKQLKKLERIIHPQVHLEIKKKIRQYKYEMNNDCIIILDIPLLFETDMHRDVDQIIVVKTNFQTQIRRAVKKFKVTKAEVLRRIKQQMPLRNKIRLADMIIDNSKMRNYTKKQVEILWQKL